MKGLEYLQRTITNALSKYNGHHPDPWNETS